MGDKLLHLWVWSYLQDKHTSSKPRVWGGGSILTPDRPLHLLLLQDRCGRQEAVETVQLRQEGQQVVEEGARHGDREKEQGVQDVRQHGACCWIIEHIWSKETEGDSGTWSHSRLLNGMNSLLCYNYHKGRWHNFMILNQIIFCFGLLQ